MEIRYLGHASFLIKTKDAKLVTDPFDPTMVGMKFPKTDADVVTISHQHKDHNQAKNVEGAPLIIEMPGEYQKKGIRVTGYQSFHDNVKGAERGENIIYKIESEGLAILHCGDLGYVPEDGLLDLIGVVDILMVPVGNNFSLGPDQAETLIKKIEPSIVIPMHFNSPKHNQAYFSKLLSVKDFLRKMGAENVSPLPKLVIKKEDIIEEIKVVLLEP
jgi:L-ascorbate metabolism protein UlaG (beta-lactamase superfamily)